MIDTSVWKPFKVSDIFITKKHGSELQTPTGAAMSKKNLEDGDTPRVTVSNFNNGITGYYADSDNKNRTLHIQTNYQVRFLLNLNLHFLPHQMVNLIGIIWNPI